MKQKNKFQKIINKIFHAKDGHDPDYTFIVLLGVMLIIGMIFLSSASSVISYDKHFDAYYFFKQQLFQGIIFGSILFLIISRINYNFLKKVAVPFLLVSIALVILVLVPEIGAEYMGGRRWIKLPWFSFQPTELLKLALIIYLASWFESREKDIKSFKNVFLPFIVLLGSIGGIVMLQPDMGGTVLIIAICMSVYFMAGGHLGLIFITTVAGSSIFYLLINQAAYRVNRLKIFLHPELDPQGIGYHIHQAFLAIGSGGIFGRGIGHSRQKFNYLPEVAGDSIFAIIAEELGFIFVTLLVLFFFYFFYRGMKIAKYAPDTFAKLTVAGIMSWIIWQMVLNIMAMVGLVPLTGTPLPFISLGSSSLLILLVAMGIVVNISRYTKNRR